MSEDQEDLLSILRSLDDTTEERSSIVRSPFPYLGSKERAIRNHKFLEHLPYGDTWVEAFGGSGVVTLNRRKSKLEVFNDRHSGIVSFYRCIRDKDKCEQLIHRLELTVHSREEFQWCRDTWEHDPIDDVERAARWYYIVNYSFVSKGVAFGRSTKPLVKFAGKFKDKLDNFHALHDRFERVQIENLDWRTVLKDYDSPETVFYLDPPYFDKNCYQYNMTKIEHVELCTKIFECEGFVALSGYANEIYDTFTWDAKHSWHQRVTATTKANDSIGIQDAEECLWIKFQNS